MYYSDHAPPHFHARYGDYEILVQISPLGVLKGEFPPRALSLVMEWGLINQKSLLEDWENATNHKKLHKIPPLR